MSFARRIRLTLLWLPLLLAAGGAVAAVGERGTLAIVAPDVEIVADRAGAAVLPSAIASEAVAARWLAAVASTLQYAGPVPVWTPPPGLDDGDRLAQVLALQEAIADNAEADPAATARRPPTLGDGARELAAATGATHALFARIRGGGEHDAATALLFDLRDGKLVAHRVARLGSGDGGRAVQRLARAVLGRNATGWRPTGLAASPPRAGLDDLDRAAERLERSLGRSPLRVDAAELDAYLRDVACRIDPDGCAAIRPYVLREPGAQATALHGGALVLRTGLLLRLRDEAELAFVLAHELAHARRGDGRRRSADDTADDDAAARARETDADADAFARLGAAGYDVAAATRLWRRLLDEQRADGTEILRASHPLLAERLAAAAAEPGVADADAGERGVERLRARIAPFLHDWLAEEVLRGRREATAAMLQAALADTDADADADTDSGTTGTGTGTDADTVVTKARAERLFALAQIRRLQDARSSAAALLAAATALPGAPPAAWRELGLARLASGDEDGAHTALRHYLALAGDADDAAFVHALLGRPAPLSSTPPGDMLRVLGLRLPDRLPWIRRPGIGVELWTIDGLALNRLVIVSNVAPGQPLFRDVAADAPAWRAGRRPDEIRDLVVATLTGKGWRNARAPGLRPHDFGGVPGWRAELELADARGLRHRGTMAFAERSGRLTLLVWLAAAGHYHGRDAADVAATLDGLRFAD